MTRRLSSWRAGPAVRLPGRGAWSNHPWSSLSCSCRLMFLLLSQTLVKLQEASLCRRHTVIPGHKASSHRWGDIAGICGDCRYVFWSGSSPGTLAAVLWTKTGHMTPPSCFVVKSERLFTQVGIKSNLRQMRHQKHPLLRPTGERGKQPQTNFVSSFENAWEGHWDSVCRFTSAHGRGENRSDKLADAVLCARKPEGVSISFVFKFRLGSAGEPNVCSHCYDVLNEAINLNFLGLFDVAWNLKTVQ